MSSADCGGDDDGSDDGGDVGIPARVTNDMIYPTTDKTYPTTDINYSTIGKYFAVSERYVNKFSPGVIRCFFGAKTAAHARRPTLFIRRR